MTVGEMVAALEERVSQLKDEAITQAMHENAALMLEVEELKKMARDLTEKLEASQKECDRAKYFADDFRDINLSLLQELEALYRVKVIKKPAVSVGQFLYECDPTSRKLLVWKVESLRYMERAGLPPMDFWTVGLKRVQMDGALGKLFCFMAADIGVTLFKTPEEALIRAGLDLGGVAP